MDQWQETHHVCVFIPSPCSRYHFQRHQRGFRLDWQLMPIHCSTTTGVLAPSCNNSLTWLQSVWSKLLQRIGYQLGYELTLYRHTRNLYRLLADTMPNPTSIVSARCQHDSNLHRYLAIHSPAHPILCSASVHLPWPVTYEFLMNQFEHDYNLSICIYSAPNSHATYFALEIPCITNATISNYLLISNTVPTQCHGFCCKPKR